MFSKRAYIIILASLVIIRIIMVSCLVIGTPETKYHQGWFFHHGGDEEEFFKLAFSFANFQPVPSYRGLGFPLLLVPFIWIFRADSITDILAPVVIFHASALFGISIFLVALIAQRLTQSRIAAVISALIWTFYPYFLRALILFLSPRHYEVSGIWMTHWMWVQVLSEPLSICLVLSAIYSFLLSRDKEGPKYAILSGFLFGWAVLTRLENSVLLILFASVYLSQKQIKKLSLFLASFFTGFMPQLFYNFYFFRAFFKFPIFDVEKAYMSEGGYGFIFSFANILFLLENLWNKLPKSLLLLSFCILIVILWALAHLYKQDKLKAQILALWIFLYSLIYGCSTNASHHDPCRYWMPVIPAVIMLLSYWLVFCANIVIKNNGE